eukprot:TRINITY_DN2657_c0_g1_i2.p1 TRINITY_DN2657_c0_g1~~TRINITY_DN2657_c0_g1_i2.p1  ORF type:complete len:131 (-),score=2.69 TRINITY_DN2657_c0_g1_i2:119-511(-)
MKLLAIFNLFIFLLFVSKSISLSVINGTGSTLAQPVYNNYIFAYTLIKPSISITYTGSGSGIGRTSVVNNSALWGGTDVGLTAIDRAQAPNVQAYPMIAGGIVNKIRNRNFMYFGRNITNSNHKFNILYT